MKPLLRVLPLLVCAVLRADTDLERGMALEKERRWEEARGAYETASKGGSAAADARLCRLHLGRFDDLEKAVEAGERAVKRDGASAGAHLSLGMAYGLKAGRSSMLKAMSLAKKSREELQRAVALEPGNAEARLLLFDFYRAAPGILGGGLDKAKALAEETLRRDELTGRRMRLALFLKEKNEAGAEEELRGVLALAPARADLRNTAGYFHLRRKRFAEAVAEFRKMIELDPSDPNGHDSLAEALLAQGTPDDAIVEYRKAVEMDRGFVSSWLGLGQAYEAKGAKGDAVRSYCEAVRTRPKSGAAKEAEKRLEVLGAKCATAG